MSEANDAARATKGQLVENVAQEQLAAAGFGMHDEDARFIVDRYRRELGPKLVALLDDPDVTDIYKNPQSQFVWIKTLSRGKLDPQSTPIRMDHARAYAVISTIAAAYKTEISAKRPRLNGILPYHGARITASVPPIVSSPMFYIRKRAVKVFDIEELRADGIIQNEGDVEFIRRLILDRANIFIAGPMGAGKTTFANSVLREMVTLRGPNERYAILEDTPELMCPAADRYEMLTNEELGITFNDLLFDSLRYGATSLSLGELRSAASTLLEAWTTGHRGGVTTIHGASPDEAMRRFEILLRRENFPIDRDAIKDAIQAVIVILPTSNSSRIVRSIRRLTGATNNGYTWADR